MQLIDADGDGVINFKEFAVALGLICRGDLQERLNFIFRLHLPPALPLCELEDNNLQDDDGGVDSCSEVDEAEEVDESDGIEKNNDGTILDPLGAGVVVMEGKVTRQSSTDSEHSRQNLKTHPPKFENTATAGMANSSEHFPTKYEELTKVSKTSNTSTNVSEAAINISLGSTSTTKGLTKVSDDLTNLSEFSTKPSEGSASLSEGSSDVCDEDFVRNENMGFDFIAENEFVDLDLADNVPEMRGQQGIYHVVEGSDVTDGIDGNNFGQRSEEDWNIEGKMNQVSLIRKLQFRCVFFCN